jgi:hypothetical protein
MQLYRIKMWMIYGGRNAETQIGSDVVTSDAVMQIYRDAKIQRYIGAEL